MNSCECKSLSSRAIELLSSFKDVDNCLSMLEQFSESIILNWKKWATFDIVLTSHLVL